MCILFYLFYFSFIFNFLVHAMDTTPIVKTIQNNGKDCHLFDSFRMRKKCNFFSHCGFSFKIRTMKIKFALSLDRKKNLLVKNAAKYNLIAIVFFFLNSIHCELTNNFDNHVVSVLCFFFFLFHVCLCLFAHQK